MNIFAVSRYPQKCAEALDDKRLNKMILETAQILCTVINLDAGKQVTPYRNCHVNHPIVKWAVDNRKRGAWSWLYALGIAYGNEIQHRFGRKHACQLVIEGLSLNHPHLLEYNQELIKKRLEFYNGASHKALGLSFKHLPWRLAYKEYLKARWKKDKRVPKWTKRGRPSWA